LSYVPDSTRRHDIPIPRIDPGSDRIVMADAGEPRADAM